MLGSSQRWQLSRHRVTRSDVVARLAGLIARGEPALEQLVDLTRSRRWRESPREKETPSCVLVWTHFTKESVVLWLQSIDVQNVGPWSVHPPFSKREQTRRDKRQQREQTLLPFRGALSPSFRSSPEKKEDLEYANLPPTTPIVNVNSCCTRHVARMGSKTHPHAHGVPTRKPIFERNNTPQKPSALGLTGRHTCLQRSQYKKRAQLKCRRGPTSPFFQPPPSPNSPLPRLPHLPLHHPPNSLIGRRKHAIHAPSGGREHKNASTQHKKYRSRIVCMYPTGNGKTRKSLQTSCRPAPAPGSAHPPTHPQPVFSSARGDRKTNRGGQAASPARASFSDSSRNKFPSKACRALRHVFSFRERCWNKTRVVVPAKQQGAFRPAETFRR